jgi:hypothetical protein
MKRAFRAVLVVALLASSFAFLPAFASNLDYWTEKRRGARRENIHCCPRGHAGDI